MHQQIATRIDHQCSIGGTIGIRAGMVIGVALGIALVIAAAIMQQCGDQIHRIPFAACAEIQRNRPSGDQRAPMPFHAAMPRGPPMNRSRIRPGVGLRGKRVGRPIPQTSQILAHARVDRAIARLMQRIVQVEQTARPIRKIKRTTMGGPAHGRNQRILTKARQRVLIRAQQCRDSLPHVRFCRIGHLRGEVGMLVVRFCRIGHSKLDLHHDAGA